MSHVFDPKKWSEARGQYSLDLGTLCRAMICLKIGTGNTLTELCGMMPERLLADFDLQHGGTREEFQRYCEAMVDGILLGLQPTVTELEVNQCVDFFLAQLAAA